VGLVKSSVDMMAAGGDSSVDPYGCLVDECPAMGRRSGMNYADFAFCLGGAGYHHKKRQKRFFCKKEQAYWQQDLFLILILFI
jgi:hypothetical protein